MLLVHLESLVQTSDGVAPVAFRSFRAHLGGGYWRWVDLDPVAAGGGYSYEMAGATFRLQVRDTEADSERLEQLTASLRRELQECPVESVEPARVGASPEGARGGELVELGTLLVNLGTAPAVAGGVVAVLRSWLSYKGSREVEVEYQGTTFRMKGSASPEDVRQLEGLILRAQERAR